MTDQTPEPRPIIIDLSPDPETIRCINEGIQRIKEQFARMRFRNTACAALTACLDGDDDRAARHLAGLDDAALYAIEAARSALAIHASRLRKDSDEKPGEMLGASCTLEAVDELADWERDLIEQQAADEQPVTDLDLPALNTAISDAHARWHEPGVYPDPAGMLAAVREAIDPILFGLRDRARRAEAERDAAVGRAVAGALEQAKTEADERVAFVERQCAAWEADAKRHLGNVDYWRQRAETAEQRADQAEELLGIAHDTANQSERARARAVQRAEVAERERDEALDDVRYLRGELSKADDENNATGERAKAAARRADEQRDRAQRAEAEAADWRTTAHGYEQALRAEQDKARAALNNAEVSIYTTIEAARSEGVDLNDMTAFQLTAAIAERLRDGDGQAKALDLRTIISDQPDQFRDWLRAELRRDPGWWREILRRELRLGWLREDFRRAGLRDH